MADEEHRHSRRSEGDPGGGSVFVHEITEAERDARTERMLEESAAYFRILPEQRGSGDDGR